MSGSGQTEKNSLRANVVRVAPLKAVIQRNQTHPCLARRHVAVRRRARRPDIAAQGGAALIGALDHPDDGGTYRRLFPSGEDGAELAAELALLG